MGNKSQIVSKVMFFVSLAVFFIFAVTVFFGGQKIAGAIYFIFFAMSVAFACIDKKYNSNFFEFYRYAIYLDDLVNILAVSSIIYYKQDGPFMIAVLSLIGLGLFVDLLAKNRLGKRRLTSVIASILNCVLMLAIFPYFFQITLPIVVPIVAVVVSAVVGVLKIILAVIPFKEQEKENEKQSNIELAVSKAAEEENNIE